MTIGICRVLREEDIIKKRLDILIDKGIKDNKEYGLNICINDRLSLTDECKGTNCEIELKKNCPNNTKDIVGFHVHLQRGIPSGRDYITTARFKEKSLCIGYRILGKNMVNCYKVPDNVKQLIDTFELNYNEKSYIKQKYPDDKQKLEKLENIETKLNDIYDKIKKIDNIGIRNALDYAKNNKLCDLVLNDSTKNE